MRPKSSEPIHKSKSVTLARDTYCYVLTVGKSGPYFFGTAHGLRRGIEKYCRQVPFKEMSDLYSAVEKNIKAEQRANSRKAFGQIGTVILFLFLVSPLRAGVVDDLMPLVKMAESSGDPRAVSNGSWGLYQISQPVLDDYNRIHGTEVTVEELFNPLTNEIIARWYLDWLNDWLSGHGYPDDPQRLIYSYNTGMGKLRRNNFKIPEWTKDHPNRIYRSIYRGELPR